MNVIYYTFDDKSTLVQVMAWCRQAPSHYLNQCWPISMSPYGVTRHNECIFLRQENMGTIEPDLYSDTQVRHTTCYVWACMQPASVILLKLWNVHMTSNRFIPGPIIYINTNCIQSVNYCLFTWLNQILISLWGWHQQFIIHTSVMINYLIENHLIRDKCLDLTNLEMHCGT